MLQNRVDPQGNIIKTSARGNWMGNRGQLHDKGKDIKRHFKLKAWLICVLEFKDRRRQVMSPNLYTELFFLDEATAFAAGHRPCSECRKTDFNHFKSCWIKGNPEYGFNKKTPVAEIDEILHEERIAPNGDKVLFKEKIGNLPEGVFILLDQQPFLLVNKQLLHWTPFGYENSEPMHNSDTVAVLTPRSIVNAFSAGYQLQMSV